LTVNAEKLRLIFYPDPRLRQRCKPVERFDAELARITARMLDIMHERHGLGLAAPQMGLLLRVFVCQPEPETPSGVYVNPTLVLGADERMGEEGCLSIPDVTIAVRRAVTCEIHAFDVTGQPIKLAARDLTARIWQHEYDHLDGRLITDRMTEAERITHRRILKELERDYEATKRKR
jgi:peptide deformylase